MALAGAIHAASAQAPTEEAIAIRALLTKTWDKPEAKLVADPIVVVDDYAIAGWTQGQRGGRALLRRIGKAWSVVLCSGDPLKHAAALIEESHHGPLEFGWCFHNHFHDRIMNDRFGAQIGFLESAAGGRLEGHIR